MDSPVLNAIPREIIGKKVKTLRQIGQLPVIAYGHGTANRNLTVQGKEFTKLASAAGSSTLVDLIINTDSPVKVLIHDLQYDPLTGNITHADLLEVKMNEKLQTEIALRFTGEAPAVKELEGNLVTTKDALKVEAFPQDLLPEIEVDISRLVTFDDKITVADVKVPSTITILDDPEETLAVVTAPRSEAELEAELAPTTEEAEAAAVAATEEASSEKVVEEVAAAE